MSERSVKIPDGMLEAAINRACESQIIFEDQIANALANIKTVLEAALLWATEHPRVPTEGQMASLRFDTIPETAKEMQRDTGQDWAKRMTVEWQRRMWLADPEPPGAQIVDLLWDAGPLVHPDNGEHNRQISEAYKRGQQSQQSVAKINSDLIEAERRGYMRGKEESKPLFPNVDESLAYLPPRRAGSE